MTPYIFDVIVVLILFYTIGTGTSKGFTGTIIRFIGYIVAVGVASTLCAPLSEGIYTEVVKPYITELVEKKVDTIDFDLEKQIEDSLKEKGIDYNESSIKTFLQNNTDLAEKTELTNSDINDTLTDVYEKYYKLIGEAISKEVPGFISDGVKKYVETNEVGEDFFNSNNQKSKVAEYIEDKIVRPVALKTLRVIVFGILFAVSMFLVRIIARIAGFIKKIPVVGGVDRFFGGLIGVVQGLIIVVVFSGVIFLVVSFSNNTISFINNDIICNTIIFKYFYNGLLSFIA